MKHLQRSYPNPFRGESRLGATLPPTLAAALDGRDTEPYEFHMFYGFVALLAVGLIYSYRTHLRAHIHLFYGLGSLFLMGLGLRAMTLGPTGGL